MARPAVLSADRIVEAASILAVEEGANAVTARRVGKALDCDPSALYRHFATMEALHRAVGDRVLAVVDTAGAERSSAVDFVRSICLQIRAALLSAPRLAPLVQGAPTRLPNEVRITEALLGALLANGMSPPAAAAAYHALVELTVGSAVIDAEATLDGSAAYRRWREDYASVGNDHPAIASTASHLYRGTAGERFEYALDALLRGLGVD